MSTPDAPFEAPWQAQVFALTVAMNEAGHFDWPEWSATFGPRVQNAGTDAYWRIWSETLIDLLNRKGIVASKEVRDLAAQWKAAARATPHGTPIQLSAAP